MATKGQGKMVNYIGYRLKVHLNDNRTLVGQMMAFDKHMNLVLADTEEFRKVKRKVPKGSGQSEVVEHEDKRTLGLIILRGSTIVGHSIEGPPPAEPSARLGRTESTNLSQPLPTMTGPGSARPTGRGMPAGLTGPAAGVGGPGPAPPGQFPPSMYPPGFPGRGMPPGGPPGFAPGPPHLQGQAPPGSGMPPFPGQGPPSGPPGFGGRGYPPPGQGGK